MINPTTSALAQMRSLVSRRSGSGFASAGLRHYSAAPPKQPNQSSRTSPGKTPVQGEPREHPGYTSYSTPATSANPKDIPAADASATPASEGPIASTRPTKPHPEVHTMAKGAETPEGGADSVGPVDRVTKVWANNARMPEFNPEEGRRNPVLDGGSHEGGLREDGKGSKT